MTRRLSYSKRRFRYNLNRDRQCLKTRRLIELFQMTLRRQDRKKVRIFNPSASSPKNSWQSNTSARQIRRRWSSNRISISRLVQSLPLWRWFPTRLSFCLIPIETWQPLLTIWRMIFRGGLRTALHQTHALLLRDRLRKLSPLLRSQSLQITQIGMESRAPRDWLLNKLPRRLRWEWLPIMVSMCLSIALAGGHTGLYRLWPLLNKRSPIGTLVRLRDTMVPLIKEIHQVELGALPIDRAKRIDQHLWPGLRLQEWQSNNLQGTIRQSISQRTKLKHRKTRIFSMRFRGWCKCLPRSLRYRRCLI